MREGGNGGVFREAPLDASIFEMVDTKMLHETAILVYLVASLYGTECVDKHNVFFTLFSFSSHFLSISIVSFSVSFRYRID